MGIANSFFSDCKLVLKNLFKNQKIKKKIK